LPNEGGGTEVQFLSLNDVVAMHRDQLERYGGREGLRDRQLLESALAQPEAAFAGAHLHRDVYEMAAAYAFHLIMNHAFVDGNKRVGYAAAETFLILNGYETTCSDDEAYSFVVSIASGSATKADVASWFERHTRQT
jgi:death on curing protein